MLPVPDKEMASSRRGLLGVGRKCHCQDQKRAENYHDVKLSCIDHHRHGGRSDHNDLHLQSYHISQNLSMIQHLFQDRPHI